MQKTSEIGFREREHTADWELEVWGPDLVTLLEQAARGMYALTHIQLSPESRLTRELELPYDDPESLLVDFLSELLYLGEDQGIGFDSFEIRLDGDQLQAELEGAPIQSQAKEIKAVTYHNLRVRQTERGLEVNIVFDV
ncbi:MAG: archease [Anaerolineales bacterium]|jgi:SHS2 domain-containing protein